MKSEQNHALPADTLRLNGALFTQERRQQIVHILEEQQRVTVGELSQLFSVSEVTIRKDLAWLEAQHLALRTHGGAVLPSSSLPSVEIGFETRERMQQAEKERIGALAATYVQDGETIALDASTTAVAMTRFLKTKLELTVVTNGLRTAQELLSASGTSVLIPGGMLRRESLSLIGKWGTSILHHVHISKAFVGAKGFTLADGLTDVNEQEVEIKRAMVEAAREVIALVDSSKWDQIAFATFCPLERIKILITDNKAPADLIDQVRKKGIEVWIA